jgi:quercetin dioxygenase-like cupin family protein
MEVHEMQSTATPIVSPPEGGEVLSFLGGAIAIRVDGAQTGGAFALIDQLLPQGAATPLHVHPTQDETFYVISGEITVYRDGALARASAGDVVSLPRGVPHAFRVDSDEAHLLDVTAPAGHEVFFRLAGDPAGAFETSPLGDPPDFGRIAAAAAQSELELLGPPPF